MFFANHVHDNCILFKTDAKNQLQFIIVTIKAKVKAITVIKCITRWS